MTPGQPVHYGPPSEIRTIGVLQLVVGIIYLLTFVSTTLLTCGFALLAVTPLYGAVVAALEVYNGARSLGQNPDPSPFWWRTLPILGIVSFISGDVFSCVAGIVALVLIAKPQVQSWIR
jgi:hypothetical protein